MLSFLKRLAESRKKPAKAPFTSPLVLETSCILVGDIHGRIDLLQKLLKKIDWNHTQDLVFLGDYVDRGDHAGEVLRVLFELDKSDKVTCLMGNHEKMLIDFLDNPTKKVGRWLRNGGLQTLASFGVGGVTEGSGPNTLQEAARSLATEMGLSLELWVRNLPLHYENGCLVCTHAALDPALPLSLQQPSTYLWGHPDFLKTPRTDGHWVAHGHTIVEAASSQNGRISIDTGAYYTGRLTAAILEKDAPVQFIDTISLP